MYVQYGMVFHQSVYTYGQCARAYTGDSRGFWIELTQINSCALLIFGLCFYLYPACSQCPFRLTSLSSFLSFLEYLWIKFK